MIVFLLLASAWCLAETLAQPPRRHRPAGPASARWLPPLMGPTVLAVMWVSMIGAAAAPAGMFALAGAMLMTAGIALRVCAIRTLGAWFLDEIALAADHPLTTHGVCAWIRHPSEAGTLCLTFGSAALLGSVAGIAMAVLCVGPLIALRIRLEDERLAIRDRRAFATYATMVPALIPRRMIRRSDRSLPIVNPAIDPALPRHRGG